MKSIIFVLALVAIAAAGPVPVENEPIPIVRSELEKEPVKILRSEFEQQPNGPYVFSFESEDGTSRNEKGELKEVLDEENKPHTVVVVKGTYTFKNNLGQDETIIYEADELGFRAEGASIPKPVEPVSRR